MASDEQIIRIFAIFNHPVFGMKALEKQRFSLIKHQKNMAFSMI